MELPFYKMQGAGNDFVVAWKKDMPTSALSGAVEKLCNRRFGIGADQFLLLSETNDKTAPFHMQTLNQDGSDGGICGNGLRCVARYLFEKKFVTDPVFRIATPVGIKEADVSDIKCPRVEMGQPRFDFKSIPFNAKAFPEAKEGEVFVLECNGHALSVLLVSMGNPHVVVFCNNLSEDLVTELGPKLENHEAFPERTNVMFAAMKNADVADVLHWERGSGKTLACGSGACAVGAASIKAGKAKDKLCVRMRGGELWISWQQGESVTMQGPAEFVFNGKFIGDY